LQAATADQFVHKTPPATVAVAAVTETGVVLTLNAWVDAAHFRQRSSELSERAAASLADL